MKKIILSLVLVFLMINYSKVFAQIPNWEFIPESGSYLENENFAFIGIYGRATYKSINYIKVKENQEYTFVCKVQDSNMEEIEMYSYNANKEKVDIIYYVPNNYYFTFKTLSNVSYIVITIDFLGEESAFGGEVEDDLIMIEGNSVPSNYSTIIYNGINHGYQEVSTKYAYLTKEVGEVFNVNNFRSKLMAYDYTDGDVSEGIYVAYDYYTPNYDKCGLWEIMFRVSDSVENEIEFALFVYNKDNVAPIIVGPSLITTTKEEMLTDIDIISNFSAYDEIDLDVSDSLIVNENAYYNNASKVGEWYVCLEASDKSGNKVTYACYIKVIDNEAPIFVIDPLIVNLTFTNQKPTLENIISNLKIENQISSFATIEILYDGYSNVEGQDEYFVRLLIDEEIKDLKIILTETISEEKPNIIKKVFNAIKNFFVEIFNLFKKLWEIIF
ncbi:MAG: hypothetical protein ACOX4W_04575 [Bacilli bacterium]